MTHSIRQHLGLVAVLAAVLSLFGPALAQEEGASPTLDQITAAWLASPHADRSSGSFTHWDDDGEIPGSCAVCHSSTGAIDYMAGPMSTPGILDHPVPLGTVVECDVCHGPAATALTAVPFPSGVTVDGFGTSATCAVCHQGRASADTVRAAVGDLAEDAVSGDLSFINIHYSASAATLMGSAVHGGYEYGGKSYQGQFAHVPGFGTCVECHQPHSLDVPRENCVACHQNAADFSAIRLSVQDYDGDGNVAEGIADPIATLHERLYAAIRDYATSVAGTPIIYANAYPYFFIDGDGDGAVTEGEAAYPNRYQSWTPRLLQAAYNYQFVAKDSAAYVHNPRYALQLLFDSLESLSQQVTVDMSGLVRP
ncbi:MAG: polyheme membrane-associated cytochrome C [Rhodobacteraceae bacterium]|nr:polyheme membrane-associated cytochrome C [Paracoccaceae bacterium]